MSRQTELLAKISIVGLEICFVIGIGAGLYLYSAKRNQAGLIIACVVAFFALIFNCMLYCYRDKLKVAIAVIDAAADYYAATKRMIFVSIFYFALQIAFFAGFVATTVFLYSTFTFKVSPYTSDLPN
jgi:hypothetical protein